MTEHVPCRVAVPARDALGESPFWDARTATLLRVDFTAGILHEGDRFHPTGRAVCSFVLPCEGGVVYGSGHEVVHRHGEQETVLARIDGSATVNDAACDERGRLWLGTYALDGSAVADLHRFAPRTPVRSSGLGLRGPNGIGWSPLGDQMYVVESHDRTLLALPYDVRAGTAGTPRVLHDFGDLPGVPDGLAVDTGGGIWVAVPGAGALVRVAPDGARSRIVGLPVSRPTNLALVGGGRAWVTTATNRLDDEQLAAEPWAGSVLEVELGATGVPTHPWPCVG